MTKFYGILSDHVAEYYDLPKYVIFGDNDSRLMQKCDYVLTIEGNNKKWVKDRSYRRKDNDISQEELMLIILSAEDLNGWPRR